MRRKDFGNENEMDKNNRRYRNNRRRQYNRRQYNEKRHDEDRYYEDGYNYYNKSGKHNRYNRKGKKRDFERDFNFDDFEDFSDYFDETTKTHEQHEHEVETEASEEDISYKGKIYNSVLDWLKEAYQEGQTQTVLIDGKSHVVGVVPNEGIGFRMGDEIVQLNPGFISSERLPDGSFSEDLRYHIEIEEDKPTQIYNGFDALAVRLSNFVRRFMNNTSGLPVDEVMKSPNNKVFPDPIFTEKNIKPIPMSEPIEVGPITATWVEEEPAGFLISEHKLPEDRLLPNLTSRIDSSKEALEDLNLPDALVSVEALNRKNASMALNSIRNTLDTASVIDDMLLSHDGMGEYYKEWKALSDYEHDFDKASRARELERIMASRLSLDGEFLEKVEGKMSELAISQKSVIGILQNPGVTEVLKTQYIVEIESLMSDSGMTRLTEVLHFTESIGLSEMKAGDMAVDEEKKNKIFEDLKENIEAFKRALGILFKKFTGGDLEPGATPK